jgi:D-beta-D-heptose 7-phosphate kinase/D-beta-D-heptose 1-phosphate adenosyltransferase
VVVGDLMLDRYWWGTVERLSPEAPVPVVHRRGASVAPGGAANVAVNVASLGGTPRLVGVVGGDDTGRELMAALKERGISPDGVVVDPARPTTVKTRVVAHSQHVVRIDEEDRRPIPDAVAARVVERLTALLDAAPVVAVSDYAKGLLTPGLLSRVMGGARAAGCPVLVDPKGTDYARYDGAHLLAPNRGEALVAAGLTADEPDGVERAAARLLDRVAVDAVLVTLGEAGMTLFERGKPPVRIAARARAVYDVTGAGDTVMAATALALAAGVSLETAVRLANVAAGLAVETVGTTAVTAERLRAALS